MVAPRLLAPPFA